VANSQQTNRDPLSRAGLRQLLWLGAAAAAGFVALMAALAFASSLTSSRGEHLGAVNFDKNAISVAMQFEPPQLDSTRTKDTQSGMILTHIMEGLLRYDAKGDLVPGVAEKWDVRADGATFWLRADARWSDGKPVTASDFVFAWRTAADPRTASQYGFLLYAVKNGEAINQGKLPPEALGVHAIGDRVLEVEFENPIAYFDKLVAFPTFNPIREDFYRSCNGSYGADADKMLYNGPFAITSWVHGASLRLEKNPLYWDRDSIKLDIIDIPYITTDVSALLNLYRDGEIASVERLNAEGLDQAVEERYSIGRFSDGSVWYLELNHRPGRLTSNYHFRKALQLVMDNVELVNKVLKLPSYIPTDSIFPSWLKGEHGYFRQEHPAPKVSLILCDDTTIATRTAEYLQEVYVRKLGLEVKIDKQIFKQRLAKSEAGDFDIIIAGWGPDYNDPLTFGDMFASWNLNNNGRYENPKLDEQVRIAQRSLDPAVRMAAFAEIQRILVDDVVIVLNYERGQMYVQDPRLKGVAHNAIGAERDYTRAYIVRNP
jgi:oligopeptide transport system substrate-binding protein